MLRSAGGANDVGIVFLHLVEEVRQRLTAVFAKNVNVDSTGAFLVCTGHSPILGDNPRNSPPAMSFWQCKYNK